MPFVARALLITKVCQKNPNNQPKQTLTTNFRHLYTKVAHKKRWVDRLKRTLFTNKTFCRQYFQTKPQFLKHILRNTTFVLLLTKRQLLEPVINSSDYTQEHTDTHSGM